ncbi:ATP-grasp domain-containing protein [Candidatus Woesearchaeota archaeon]|nr:ATP-grasp domain-containing protein [Candidatus Woesearchaeota archaeon]
MNIALLYTSLKQEGSGLAVDFEGRDKNDNVIAVDEALRSLGHETNKIYVNLDMFENLKRLKDEIDIAFNLCDDGFHNASELEPHVPAVLDILKVPYTGSDYRTLATCLNKARTKEILSFHKIPTPRFQVFDSLKVRLDNKLRFPLIVKPVSEDASIGIKKESIVNSEEELMRRVFLVLDAYKQPALAEEFIDGREANVGVIGAKNPSALPISEILFDNLSDGLPNICTYSAKWVEDSDYYKSTPPRCPAEIDERLANRLRKIALKAYTLMGCQDYGRVDFRIDKDGNPFVLEVNPNPDISPDAGLARMAKAAGMSYADLMDAILKSALEKNGLKPKTKIDIKVEEA